MGTCSLAYDLFYRPWNKDVGTRMTYWPYFVAPFNGSRSYQNKTFWLCRRCMTSVITDVIIITALLLF